MLRRLHRELRHLSGDGVYACCTDELTRLQALVVGPEDTPYDAALLSFELRVPETYPLQPPEAERKSGRVRRVGSYGLEYCVYI